MFPVFFMACLVVDFEAAVRIKKTPTKSQICVQNVFKHTLFFGRQKSPFFGPTPSCLGPQNGEIIYDILKVLEIEPFPRD